jgi:hypothetical protein
VNKRFSVKWILSQNSIFFKTSKNYLQHHNV